MPTSCARVVLTPLPITPSPSRRGLLSIVHFCVEELFINYIVKICTYPFVLFNNIMVLWSPFTAHTVASTRDCSPLFGRSIAYLEGSRLRFVNESKTHRIGIQLEHWLNQSFFYHSRKDEFIDLCRSLSFPGDFKRLTA